MFESSVISRSSESQMSCSDQRLTLSAPVESNRSPTQADFKVGHRIKQLRRQQGLTQKEIADRVGVTGAQLHRYEVGTTRVAASRLLAIADALGVPPERLMGEPAPLARATVDAAEGGDLVELVELFSAMSDKRRRDAVIYFARSLAVIPPAGTDD